MRTKTRYGFGSTLGLALVLVLTIGCGVLIGAPAPLPGTSWLLAFINRQPALLTISVTANFDATRIFGTDGCNQYSGTYTANGGSLTFGPIQSTLVACDAPVMAQAQAYQAALATVKSHEATPRALLMKDGSGNTVLEFVPQPTTINGTSWTVTGYNNGKQAVVSVMAGTRMTARFGTDAQLTGNAGCNDYTSGYSVNGDSINISQPASTRKACADPEGVMEQEAAYLAALPKAFTFVRDGSRLELRAADGSIVATFAGNQ